MNENELLWEECVTLAPDFGAVITEMGIILVFTHGEWTQIVREARLDRERDQYSRCNILLRRALDILQPKSRKRPRVHRA